MCRKGDDGHSGCQERLSEHQRKHLKARMLHTREFVIGAKGSAHQIPECTIAMQVTRFEKAQCRSEGGDQSKVEREEAP